MTTTYEYRVKISKGFPLVKKSLDKLGREGWRLVGVVKITTYPVDKFWYYFVREGGED